MVSWFIDLSVYYGFHTEVDQFMHNHSWEPVYSPDNHLVIKKDTIVDGSGTCDLLLRQEVLCYVCTAFISAGVAIV